MKIERKDTSRGFVRFLFTDRYSHQCSLQKSSLGSEDAIWLGVDNPEPKVMAMDAASVGVVTRETTGWVPFPVPEQVSLSTRMHLTQEQVKELLPILEHFAETGELPDSTPPASEQQRAVVMPERRTILDPADKYCCKEVACEAWNDALDELLRLNPHLAKGEGV